MKSLLLLLALTSVAYADSWPHEGPCEDAAACEKACTKGKTASCYYGGVLVMQTVEEGREERAKKLFDKACTKGDAEGCYQSARLVSRLDTEDPDRKKTLAAFKTACTKNHARACFSYASMIKIPEEGGAKQEKLATDARKKGLKLFEQRCIKNKMAGACDTASNLYVGVSWLKPDPKKAGDLRERACQIRTGAACPPPAPAGPPPGRPDVFTKQAKPPIKQGKMPVTDEAEKPTKQGADPGPPKATKVDTVPTTIQP